MIKELSNEEYESLIGRYSIVHFMGGCSGTDNHYTIYLVNDKSILVSNDETEEIEKLQIIQRQEANDYFDSLDFDK